MRPLGRTVRPGGSADPVVKVIAAERGEAAEGEQASEHTGVD